jgi:hypothetical protein
MGEWRLSSVKRRTARRPQTVKRLATIATEYVVVKQGMYVEWKKHAYTERGQKCTRAYI